jgi:hypothetical protein
VIDAELYALIVAAERAARAAHDRCVALPRSSWLLRSSLGRAQSLLMSNVVRYAGDTSEPEGAHDPAR